LSLVVFDKATIWAALADLSDNLLDDVALFILVLLSGKVEKRPSAFGQTQTKRNMLMINATYLSTRIFWEHELNQHPEAIVPIMSPSTLASANDNVIIGGFKVCRKNHHFPGFGRVRGGWGGRSGRAFSVWSRFLRHLETVSFGTEPGFNCKDKERILLLRGALIDPVEKKK
jgi:hypothetical protein